ncbi:MAG: metallophosphoesterase [Coraliomargarita sp.]|nr:metallophosphoesterase [Coraliomargarita sp.]
MSRTIAIGDVHGCAEEFAELLEALNTKPKDRLIQLGDLINRGPDSRGAVELAREYGVEGIVGNHELRILTALRKQSPNILKDYDLTTIKQLHSEDWRYLEGQKQYIHDTNSDTVFVHGGFLPIKAKHWTKQTLSVTTNIQVIDEDGKPAKRSDAPDAPAWADKWEGPPFVVYGHTPRPNVYQRSASIGIDTGCVYGGHLTAFIVEDQSFVQVRARKAYAHSKRLPNPI